MAIYRSALKIKYVSKSRQYFKYKQMKCFQLSDDQPHLVHKAVYRMSEWQHQYQSASTLPFLTVEGVDVVYFFKMVCVVCVHTLYLLYLA